MAKKISEVSHRATLSDTNILTAIDDMVAKLKYRIEQKGQGAWLSRHEILGILTEEFTEVIDEIHSKGRNRELKQELLDLAVGCIFAVACINQETLDW